MQRRYFLRSLFTVGAATVATPMVPMAEAERKDIQVFHFQCFCGENIVAEVPKPKSKWFLRKKWLTDTSLAVRCKTCHHEYNLTWRGSHFRFSDHWVRETQPAPFGDPPMQQLASDFLGGKRVPGRWDRDDD